MSKNNDMLIMSTVHYKIKKQKQKQNKKNNNNNKHQENILKITK